MFNCIPFEASVTPYKNYCATRQCLHSLHQCATIITVNFTRSNSTSIAPKDLIEEVDKLGDEFLTEAAAEKLKREKLLRLTREATKLPAEEGVPGWETPEAVSKWVHDLRTENDRIRKV